MENQTITDFKNELLGDVITPEDSRYDRERQVWNGLIDKHPALIAKYRGTSDVIHCVKFARENDLQVSIRGGGHNVQVYNYRRLQKVKTKYNPDNFSIPYQS